MQIYLVGGAVRDRLLGREITDRDWVVVGADAATMLQRGFSPVGKDFPVFLHPQSHEEYALARTERKTAKGYAGFSFYAAADVTLEQDLQRRDFTVNAMAQDSGCNIIDPFGGREDLRMGVLRHVSPAFAEDPVRILRAARFAARYGFNVAAETMALMRQMNAEGETAALVAERVWQELAKGLMEQQPERMLEVLHDSGTLAVILPELAACFGTAVPADSNCCADFQAALPLPAQALLRTLQLSAQNGFSLPERYASLFCRFDDLTALKALNSRLRVPKNCAETALTVCAHSGRLHRVSELDAAEAFQVLKDCDALRRRERFAAVLNVCRIDWQAHHGGSAYPQAERWQALLAAAETVDTRAIAAHAGADTADAIAAARIAAIAEVQAACRTDLPSKYIDEKNRNVS